MKPKTELSLKPFDWRHIVILGAVVSVVIAILLQAPFGQDQAYHNFADKRPFFGIPNFGDVASNLGFLIAGLAGLYVCLTRDLGSLRTAWIVMFGGITSVALGSGYYHWDPNDQTLVWDRITLTVGFMGMSVGFLGDYFSDRFRWILAPAVVVGAYSVLHWRWFDDLRLYYAVQLVPLVTMPLVLALFHRYTHQWLMLVGAGWYVLAKLAEIGDRWIFAATGEVVSGHTFKHLFAAIGCLSILLALCLRRPSDLKTDA